MNKVIYYILDKDKNPIPSTSSEWAEWHEDINNRIVGLDEIGDVTISTVFTGIPDDLFTKEFQGLFETLVQGGKFDQEQERYATWDGAKRGHEAWVSKIKHGMGKFYYLKWSNGSMGQYKTYEDAYNEAERCIAWSNKEYGSRLPEKTYIIIESEHDLDGSRNQWENLRENLKLEFMAKYNIKQEAKLLNSQYLLYKKSNIRLPPFRIFFV